MPSATHNAETHRHRKSFPIIALNLAIVLVLAGGTAAYGALSKTVTLVVDGQRDTIRTFGDTVADVLAAKDVTVRADDRLSRPSSATLDDGDHIEVAYAKPVTVVVDGDVTPHTVYDRTVGQALKTLGVEPAPGAYVSAERDSTIPRDGAELVVSNAKSLKVIADGKESTVSTKAPTIAGVLEAAHVTLDSDDEVAPGKDTYVKPGSTIKVTRIEKVTKTETVDVKFPVEVRKDAEAMEGDVTVLEKGAKGKSREHVTLVMADGKLRDRIVLSSDVLEEPVTQVESRGTAVTPPDSVWDKIAQCESGGNWHINTGNGYYGGLQFSAATRRSVGGTGVASDHSREEQIKRAKILQARSGWGQWGCAGARFN